MHPVFEPATFYLPCLLVRWSFNGTNEHDESDGEETVLSSVMSVGLRFNSVPPTCQFRNSTSAFWIRRRVGGTRMN